MSYHSDNFLQQLLIQATSFPGMSLRPMKSMKFNLNETCDLTKDMQTIRSILYPS